MIQESVDLWDDVAERSVLSGVLLQPAALDDLRLNPEDFGLLRHQRIFESIARLWQAHATVDLVTVGANLAERKLLEEVGGRAALAEIAGELPSTQMLPHYAAILRELSALRQLRRSAQLVLQQTKDRQESQVITRSLTKALERLDRQLITRQWASMKDCLTEALEQIDAAYQGKLGAGVSTGLLHLDRKIGGLQPGHLVVVAGRPGMGKTSLALGMAVAAVQANRVAGVISLEMSQVELTKRMLAMLSPAVTMSGLEYGKISSAGWTALTNTACFLTDRPLWVADQAYITLETIERLARILKRQEGRLDLLVVDYLQLVNVEGRRSNRVEAMSEISRGLKILAKDLEVPVVALSQLSRDCEKRPDKRPVLSDLRESGSIEQDADVVICIYREEVYDEETPDLGLAELLVRKNRHGPTGEVKVRFEGPTTKFENI